MSGDQKKKNGTWIKYTSSGFIKGEKGPDLLPMKNVNFMVISFCRAKSEWV